MTASNSDKPLADTGERSKLPNMSDWFCHLCRSRDTQQLSPCRTCFQMPLEERQRKCSVDLAASKSTSESRLQKVNKERLQIWTCYVCERENRLGDSLCGNCWRGVRDECDGVLTVAGLEQHSNKEKCYDGIAIPTSDSFKRLTPARLRKIQKDRGREGAINACLNLSREKWVQSPQLQPHFISQLPAQALG